MPTDTYSISDLARLTGVNVRTIRYYLAQGLLPASGESGPGAHYGEGHLDRLRLTRRLQQQHLPLAEIRRRLAELTDSEVAGVLATSQEPSEPSPTTSALDYVRAVLGKQAPAMASPPAPAASPPAPAAMAPAPAAMAPAPAAMAPAAFAPAQSAVSEQSVVPARARLTHAPGYARMGMVSEETEKQVAPVADATPFTNAANVINSAPAAMPAMRDAPERSQWERLSLGPNIELHIRRPLGRLEQRRVERLLTIARQVLKEEKP